jgi:hypothetical protein
MLKFQGVQTELAEIPVIIVNGEIQLISPEFKKLSPQTLRDMAEAMSGILGYLKVRATYDLVESQHCVTKGCWRPAVEGTIKCDDHV